MNKSAIHKIKLLQEQISDELENRESKKKNIHILVSLFVLRAIHARLNQIKEILKIEKYDLAFIGQVGVGKTTAICHLFDLIREEETVSKSRNKKVRKIKKVKELLSIGSGKTTICEVIIRASSETFIEIEPYPEEEIIEFLKEYCIYIWVKSHPSSNQEIFDVPSAELQRALRNIIDLPIEKDFFDLASSYSSNEYQSFQSDVIKRANLINRTNTKIAFSKSSASIDEEKIWLKDNFSKINLAQLPDFSIPRKIRVYLSSHVTDLQKDSRFKSIIDTKGMDVVKDRKDLSYYIRGNDQTICIFTEEFPSAPTNVSDLIGRYLTRESKDIDSKFVLLVIPKKGEPEDILGANGKVESREEGIEQRKGDIEAAFAGQQIKFLDENILFYDALQYYLPDRTLYGDKIDIDDDKENAIEAIEDVINRRESLLYQEVEDIERVFNKIKTGSQLSVEEQKLIEDLKKTIEECKDIQLLQSNFLAKFRQLLKSKYHHSVLHAINKRYGVYEGIDIYFESKNITEELVRENLYGLKYRILGKIDTTQESASEKSALKEILQILKNQIDEYYEEISIEIGELVSDKLRNQNLFPQNETSTFWRQTQARRGKGEGYTNDVLEMYSNQISDINNYFQEKIQDFWKHRFMNKVLAFFGDEES